MNSSELSTITADPIQILGMSFYFDPLTSERAKQLGLNVYEFYGLGRGGVMGNVNIEEIDRAFTFFHLSTLNFLWESARVKADPVATADEYVKAAYAFADRTFGAVPEATLVGFDAATQKVVDAVDEGAHLLFDGYRRFDAPPNLVHAAYLGTILLRELRGGVHIEAVAKVGLTPIEACYLQDAMIFTLHGYAESDAPTVTPDLEAKKVAAEDLTAQAMADFFSVLDDDERRQLADGTNAMFAALSSPVPVAD